MTGKWGREIQGKLHLGRVSEEFQLSGFSCLNKLISISNTLPFLETSSSLSFSSRSNPYEVLKGSFDLPFIITVRSRSASVTVLPVLKLSRSYFRRSFRIAMKVRARDSWQERVMKGALSIRPKIPE